MRLTPDQVNAISQTFKKVFVKGEILLFGSRTRNDKKGGDIDLFVKTSADKKNLFDLKIQFLVELKSIIGDQKIDLVFDSLSSDALKEEIAKSGISLCRAM